MAALQAENDRQQDLEFRITNEGQFVKYMIGRESRKQNILQKREVFQWERPLSFYYNINDIRVVGAQSAE